jgi:hypothetical protein
VAALRERQNPRVFPRREEPASEEMQKSPSIFMRLNPYESKDQNIRSKLASTFIVWNQSKSKLVDLDCEVDRNKSYIVVARCATLATNRFGHRVEFDQAVMESQ